MSMISIYCMLTMFTINFPPRLDIVLMLFIIANTMIQYILIFLSAYADQYNMAKCLFLSGELLGILHVHHAGRPAGHGPVCCHGMGQVPHLDPGELVRLRIVAW